MTEFLGQGQVQSNIRVAPGTTGFAPGLVENARGGGHGLDAELAMKRAANYDYNAETSAREWIEAVTQQPFPGGFAESLKDGVLLCGLINGISPGIVSRVNESKMPFKQMENISNFLKACRAVGVPEHSLFETVDLFEEKDIGLVVQCLFALGSTVQRTVPSFQGPHLGAKDTVGAARAKMAGLSLHGGSGSASKMAPPVTPSPSAKLTVTSPANKARLPAAATVEDEIEAARTEGPTVVEGQGLVHSNIPLPKSEPLRGGVDSAGQRQYVGARGGGFGLDADLAKKRAANYDYDAELQAQEWIEAVTGRVIEGPLAPALKDGTLLCELANTIRPGVVRTVNESKMPFKQMENISNFLKACRALGVAEHSLFETVDLFEEKDMSVVVQCLHALGGTVQRTVPDFVGPHLGAKVGESAPREWTPEQREAQQRASAATPTKIMAGSQETMGRREHIVTGPTMGNVYAGTGDTTTLSGHQRLMEGSGSASKKAGSWIKN